MPEDTRAGDRTIRRRGRRNARAARRPQRQRAARYPRARDGRALLDDDLPANVERAAPFGGRPRWRAFRVSNDE
jgi:hypothetical protein